ncbi:hypothetical protein ABFX02_11G104300 [Erythranthe guttata]
MAIRGGDRARGASSDGKIQTTVEEFKKWLMSFDSNKDGRLSRDELRAAIRSSGAWFTARKSGRGIIVADADGSGYIDEDEIDGLLDFAETSMGFKFYC